MPRGKLRKPAEQTPELLTRINDLQKRCNATLERCNGLGECHLDVTPEVTACEEQLAILSALKAKLFPQHP